MKNIAIFGAGGFGREVKTIIDAINKQIPNTYNFIGFYDDGIKKDTVVNGFPVLGGVEDFNNVISDLELVIAIGDSAVKKKIIEKIDNEFISFPSLIHPKASISSDDVKLGKGCIICEGTIITCNIIIGNFVVFCKNLPIEIEYYDYNPFSDIPSVEWEDDSQNVFINVDFFGVKKIDTSFIKKSVIIDDLTHNLLSIKETKADYCFGSLRKQLPIGVGGFCLGVKEDVVFSVPFNDFANKVALQKLSAMFLKSEYLTGKFENKDVFRNLFVNAEHQFELIDTNSKFPQIIKSQLFALSEETLIQKTRNNIAQVKTKLQLKNCKIVESDRKTEFGLVMVFEESTLRNELRDYLIENNIYPAVLWPSQKAEKDVFYENRMLFIHLDFRYSREDIDFVVLKINGFFKNV